jgi:propionate CoA-transferase
MNVFTKCGLLMHILRWRLNWDKRDTREAFTVPGNPKFMGPRDAASLIKDGDTVAVSGLGGNQRASILYWAIRELFEETGHPRDLTVISIGGFGGRGRIPGTTEELGAEGLCTRFFTGHTETYKAMLKLADAGKCELQCIPQGTFALLLDELARGGERIVNSTGAGTFVDPRCGRGTPVLDPEAPQYVRMEGDQFCYTCPPVDAAVFNMPAADRDGNIYMTNAAILAEAPVIAQAARRNNGNVIVNVARTVEEGSDDIAIPAADVDAIVVWEDTEQCAGTMHRKYWDFMTLNSSLPVEEGVARLRFINRVMGITPRRKPVDDAMARLGASIFVDNMRRGDYVDIGVGLPEEVSRLLFEGGVMEDLTLLTESGVFGGLPAPGIYFGTAVNPEEIVSSSEAFKRIYNRLDAVILGALEIDSQGNVNASKRGEGAINYVGPGGFIDLVTCARVVLFCSAWGHGADIRVEGDRLRMHKPGKPKFIDAVDEITFCGPEALKAGKKVFYVTHTGAFQLKERGMELIRVMPGIDIERDIIAPSAMKIVLPENGEVPVADAAIVTGKGFHLELSG